MDANNVLSISAGSLSSIQVVEKKQPGPTKRIRGTSDRQR